MYKLQSVRVTSKHETVAHGWESTDQMKHILYIFVKPKIKILFNFYSSPRKTFQFLKKTGTS